jgi:hypothetical protein
MHMCGATFVSCARAGGWGRRPAYRAQELVDDVLLVNLFQNAGADHGVQVRLHVLEGQVDVDIVVRLENIEQAVGCARPA